MNVLLNEWEFVIMTGRRRLLPATLLNPVAVNAGQKRKSDELTESSDDLVSHKAARLATTEEEDMAGIIEAVSLQNFMCHSSLNWDPNSRVNFVTGQNGAGKSSVLQGIVLGLLGDTKSIKRYSRVAEFIKKGCGKSVISVTLSNLGEDAYKPELFGKSITFQRTINESGTSAYLLKDEHQEDVVRKSSTAKVECKRILDKFQIQLDSPIVVLHQDEAKEMLQMESPERMYSFFEQSTLIKQCFDQYSQAQMEYKRAKATVKEKARVLKELSLEIRRKQAQYDEIQRLEQKDRELKETTGEYAWARVHAARETAANLGDQVDSVTTKIGQLKSKLMSLHEKLADLKMQKTELQIEFEEESSSYSQQEEELCLLKEKLDKQKLDQKQNNTNLRQESQNKDRLSQQVRVLKEQLAEVERREGELLSMQEKRKLERKVILKQLENDKKRAEEQINKEGSTRETIDEKLREDLENAKAIRQELSSKREREKVLQQELQELQGAQGGEKRLAVFGAKIPALELEIKRNSGKFLKMPVGPVGSHLKLAGQAATNPEVGRLVETELGRAQLTSYLCDSDQDRRQLSLILDNVYGQDRNKPKIFTSKFLSRPHNVIKPVISVKNVVLLMDLLHIEDPVIFNHLVDQKSIESILVCQTQDVAKSLTTRRENVPANVSYVLSHSFHRFMPPKGDASYRTYFMEPLQGSGMLRATMTNLVQERQKEVDGLRGHLKDLESELTQVERSRASYEAERKKSLAEIQKQRSVIAKVNSQLSRIRAEEDSDINNSEMIKAKIATGNTELQCSEEKIQEILSQRDLQSDLIKENEELMKSNKRELNQLKTATNPLQKKLRETENVINLKTKEILNQEKLIKKLNTELQELNQSLKTTREEEKQFLEAGKKYSGGKELFPDKTVRQLDAKVRQLKKKIESQNADCDQEQFIEEFKALKENYVKRKKDIEQLDNLLKTIGKMNDERLDNFICIRNIISNNVRRRFNLMIKEFSKEIQSEVFLRIDNQKKELNFHFSRAGGSYSSSDTSVLSGGEKSYTQMCLICALWDMMRPPFRCLDEWDVFLDPVNRKKISEELLRFCLRNQDRQFIFISPQVRKALFSSKD